MVYRRRRSDRGNRGANTARDNAYPLPSRLFDGVGYTMGKTATPCLVYGARVLGRDDGNRKRTTKHDSLLAVFFRWISRSRVQKLSVERHPYEEHVRGHSGIGAVQIGVGNVVVLVPDIQRGAPARAEQLEPAAKLRGEVELLSGAEHAPVEIEESTATGDKWLDTAVVEEIHLRAYRTPTRTMSIYAPAIWIVRVTNHGPRNELRNVAHRNEPTRKKQACIATLDLVQAPIRFFMECISGSELLPKPDGKLVISWPLLRTNGASTEHS
jgi:hypothetical protein